MTLPSAIVRRGSIFLPSWDTISSIISLGGRMLHVLFYPRHPDIKMMLRELRIPDSPDRAAEPTACGHKFFGFN
jgi:hypothetical protein